MHGQHMQVMEDDELLSQRRVLQMRQQGEAALLAAEARAKDAHKKREDVEAQLEEIRAEIYSIMEVEAAQREQLASRLTSADIRTARAVMDVDVKMQALRGEADYSTRSTFQGLQQEHHHAWALQDRLGGLKEVVTGVRACERDQELQRVPKVMPRPFDLEESPFNGFGTFGSSRPPQVPKGFYAEAAPAAAQAAQAQVRASHAVNAAPRLAKVCLNA